MMNNRFKRIIGTLLVIVSIFSTIILNGCSVKDKTNNNTVSQKAAYDSNSSSNGYNLKQYKNQPPNTKEATVERVVDGDTIVVKEHNKEIKVRFLLVDTPETCKPNTPVQPFGEKAKQFTKDALKKGAKIYIEYGKSKSDKYGRRLGFIYYNNNGKWEMLNEALVANGLARVGYIYEDKEHLNELKEAQDYAKENKLNIWSKAGYVTDRGYNPKVFNK
ncbi:thermonuclease family protein [Clostridium sp. Ade.TY]|uniref:thermonuclease family protein n=1 Tax=Clostridium sp. Ade.TY TaxID=1391647 RepID=UPI00040C83FD|nr:thermonuclease family protein [Clostridium sp. Ade.TY]